MVDVIDLKKERKAREPKAGVEVEVVSGHVVLWLDAECLTYDETEGRHCVMVGPEDAVKLGRFLTESAKEAADQNS